MSTDPTVAAQTLTVVLARLNDMDSDLHQIGDIVAGALTQPTHDREVEGWRQSRARWEAHLEDPNENEIAALDLVCVAPLDRWEGYKGGSKTQEFAAVLRA